MIIELFSGLGRFETDEEVIYVGIQRETKPTICADVRFLPLRPKLRPRLCHASPPCTYFSRARMPLEEWNEEGVAKSLELVASVFHAFAYLEAQTWTLENPVGRLGQFFNQVKIEYAAEDFDRKATHFWSNKRGLRRAIIPKWIRDGLMSFSE